MITMRLPSKIIVSIFLGLLFLNQASAAFITIETTDDKPFHKYIINTDKILYIEEGKTDIDFNNGVKWKAGDWTRIVFSTTPNDFISIHLPIQSVVDDLRIPKVN